MKSIVDFFCSLLKFLGLLEEPPLLRKNFKRNRVYDDFSSDDETPVLGYQQVKRFRWSGIIATIDNRDKEGRYNNPIWNVPEGSYTTSTPKESPKRMVPVDIPELSRNGPSSPLNETNSRDNLDHEEPKVTWVESKLENIKKKSSILHVDLDDEDSNDSQQGDDVVFVKEETKPHEHVFVTNSQTTGLNDQVLSKVLEKIASEENLEYQELLRRIANTIKPMSKQKPIGDGKLANDSTSFRLPKTTQINILKEIKLANELNADTYQNASQEQHPIQISSSDSSDSEDDVEVVPLESSTTSSMRKDSNKNIAELSGNWLLELDSECNNKLPINQAQINDARRVSDITSKVNSDQTIARPHSDDKTDTSGDRHHHHLLLRLDSKYNNKQPHNKSVIPITQEKSNDSRRASVTPKENSEQNEAHSSSPETINDWLAKLDAKYFSTPLKTPEKLNDMQKNEAQLYKPDIAGAGLSRLEYKNKISLLKSYEKHNDAPQESKILSKVNTYEDTLDTTREWLAKLQETFSTPKKTQESLNNSRPETNIVSKVNEQTDVRSYLPAASRDWLLELDAKYNTTPQKNQENLNARLELNTVSKVNGEDRLLKQDSTDDWLAELKSRYNELNDASRESVIVSKLNNNQNESCSRKPDTARETLSKSDSKPETEQPKMQEKLNVSYQEVTSLSKENNLPKVNSEQNKVRSFKFNSSEDLMLKLGSLYNKSQQETQEKRRKSLLNPDEIKLVNREQKHELSKSKTEESDVEMPSNDDLPSLTPEQEKLVNGALEPEPEEELLVERFNLRIHRRDLQTLSDLNWLNDEVINFYMNLIMQRSKERIDLPKVYATNTFFYPKLMQSGQPGLRRWTRKVDIFAYDLFMVPVNIGHHWCLSIVDFRGRIIKYLDSRGSPNQEYLDALLQYLQDEHQDKKGAPIDVSGWKTECVTDIPQQMNGSDCGMFACTFAEFSSRGAAYSFTQAHMPYLRRKAALEILMGKLLL